MSWFRDEQPGHEGFMVGLVPAVNKDGRESDWRFRELNAQDDGETTERQVRVVQVGCSCGWRSSYLSPPRGTVWFPYCVSTPSDAFEDEVRRIWNEHHMNALIVSRWLLEN